MIPRSEVAAELAAERHVPRCVVLSSELPLATVDPVHKGGYCVRRRIRVEAGATHPQGQAESFVVSVTRSGYASKLMDLSAEVRPGSVVEFRLPSERGWVATVRDAAGVLGEVPVDAELTVGDFDALAPGARLGASRA